MTSFWRSSALAIAIACALIGMIGVAGAAVAAAANDDEHSGIISSVLVEYLQPAALGDVLYAEVSRDASTEREDIFTGTVRQGPHGDLLAWVRARGTRRTRSR